MEPGMHTIPQFPKSPVLANTWLSGIPAAISRGKEQSGVTLELAL